MAGVISLGILTSTAEQDREVSRAVDGLVSHLKAKGIAVGGHVHSGYLSKTFTP